MALTPQERRLAIRTAVAHRFQAKGPALTRQLAGALIEGSPELRDPDTVLTGLVRALARALVNEAAVGLIDLDGHEEITGSAGALALARQLGERGVPAHRVVAVYQLAQRRLFDLVLAEMSAEDLSGSDAETISPVVAWLLRVFGALMEAAGREHGATQELWRAGNGPILAADLAVVLAEIDDTDEAERLLSYDLDTRHVGLVVWSRSGRLDARRIGRLVRKFTQLTMIADVLVAPRDCVSVVAWLAVPGSARGLAGHVLQQVSDIPDLRFAFGEPLAGIEGFRETHRQALAAFDVAQLPGSLDDRWVRFREVAPTTVLQSSPEDAEVFTTRILGELGCTGEETARLRETLRVYLECGENASRAAAKLYVHRNTVNYRVGGAIELLGVPFEPNRLSVAMALNYSRRAMGCRPPQLLVPEE